MLCSNEALCLNAALGVLGLLVGSFLNVVIGRLPRMMENEWHDQCATLRGESVPPLQRFNLAYPASHCPHCQHSLSVVENIPILSWFLLKGRCKHCTKPISVRYPFVEMLSALLSVFAAWRFGLGWDLIGALVFIWASIALAGIDYDKQLLPDQITLPLLWVGLLFNLTATYTPLASAVLGSMLGYLVLWLVYSVFKLLTGKEGMGFGDFKLLAALGAWFGWTMLPLILLLAAGAATLVGVGLILLKKHDRNSPLPFGPYLVLAGWITLFWGQSLTQAYLDVLPRL